MQQLRNPHAFAWYAVFLLSLVLYIYSVEVERKRWDIVLGGVALWLADWFNEIINSVWLHVSDHSALWTTTGSTAYQILIGLNFEISCMFAIAGVGFLKFLPEKSARIFGIPAQWAAAIGFSAFSVFVEVLLHETGTFHWAYWYWNVPFVLPIFLFGYLWFFATALWVFNTPTLRRRLQIVGVLATIDAALLVLCGPVLGWL